MEIFVVLNFLGKKIGVANKTSTSKLIPQSFIPLTVLEKSQVNKKVVDLYGAGHSLNEIAEQVKKSRKSIQGILQQDGIPCDQPPKEFQTGRRVHRGKVRWNSPYGFQYDCGRAVKHPQEFETLLLIMKWHKLAMNSRTIADRLNEKKLRPRSAAKWDRCTIHRIIDWQIKHPTFLQEVISWVSKN